MVNQLMDRTTNGPCATVPNLVYADNDGLPVKDEAPQLFETAELSDFTSLNKTPMIPPPIVSTTILMNPTVRKGTYGGNVLLLDEPPQFLKPEEMKESAVDE